MGLAGCADESSKIPAASETLPATEQEKGCKGCHPFDLDRNHSFTCDTCHGGQQETAIKDEAHQNLVKKPAHPDNMISSCGNCHKNTIDHALKSIHYTLANEVNTVRRAFGADIDLDNLQQIPDNAFPQTRLDLADDLLRRRCLRCHLYYAGDQYSKTRRGTGCAACHLEYAQGQLVSHKFLQKPSDEQCLSCHYGNFVGFDFYGRFEHDFNWDYRTPFATDSGQENPPFGLDSHPLSPDVHQQRGMVCLDCHFDLDHTNDRLIITCDSCHMADLAQNKIIPTLTRENNRLSMTSRITGKKFQVPEISDKIHKQYKDIAACTVCHAKWSFADNGIHLIRKDETDFDEWFSLSRQGSSEIEELLTEVLFNENSDADAVMTDKISGEFKLGVWLKGYGIRRWSPINICKDKAEKLQVCRTLLDLNLSYSGMEDIVFDSVGPEKSISRLTPYTPHTIGKAGLFWEYRILTNKNDTNE